MRYLYLICLMLITVSANSCGKRKNYHSVFPAPDHSVWTQLLQQYVDTGGWVNYNGFVQDSMILNSYLNTLSNNPPSNSWSKNEKLTYWINVYNAFTVKLIVNHYPVTSIKDIKKGIPFINSVWEMDFFEIGGKEFNLSTVEHDILRKEFDEPRIHFAIVCASKSCPRLLNEAFESENLEQQLERQAIDFINDSSKNRFDKNEIYLSPIFKWFRKDFTKNLGLRQYVAQFAKSDFSESAKLTYTKYDWSLNGQ